MPQVRTTLLSAVPVIPRPPMSPVVRLTPGHVIASMPPMIPAPRINVVPMPPPAPHMMAPRPPPMVVPTGKMEVSAHLSLTFKMNARVFRAFVMILNWNNFFSVSICPRPSSTTTPKLCSCATIPPAATSWRWASQQEDEDRGQPYSRRGVPS